MAQADASTKRIRSRDIGIAPGQYRTGSLNAITDVAGVLVGHVTIIEGETIRTGATAILPHGGNLFQDKVPAAIAVLNGYGKFVGSTQIEELGEIETPIVLTNTLATGRAIEAINRWTLSQPDNDRVVSINPVVGETNDSRLNNIRSGRPTIDEIGQALGKAQGGPVIEGSIGAGAGTVAFGLKGGIGTSSRSIQIGGKDYMVGILVQSNYGGHLRIDGQAYVTVASQDRDGSIVIVVATDAPLSSRNLKRLAVRTFGGLARTGAALSNGSGDYAVAFSTAMGVRRTKEQRQRVTAIPDLPNELISPLFEAAIEATEESIINSLCAAETTEGFNAATMSANKIEAISLDALKRLARL
ncbi:P1 family peptidase [Phyllobacterium myrsinacearum]|uniref:D-aminopeptidase n=1 Tax=Phyllobacterium myrsinacearum TaxID=28101 RepID=A0A839EQG6_9HYPH|nr:P1 family peptidase [Phyllobacterium myrsinacearum]MBA8878870.1 D-aminopeptidase [Phyllobacterium myrsinacearum]